MRPQINKLHIYMLIYAQLNNIIYITYTRIYNAIYVYAHHNQL